MIKIFNKYSVYICISLLILSFILLYLYINKSEIEYIERIEYKEKEYDKYYVDIKGEVNNPGVYEIESNKRIIDAISIAGGLTKNSDTSLLNLSKKVTDEMNIKIYSKKEVNDAINNIESPTVIEIIKEIEKECICPSVNDACINNNEAKDNNSSLVNINIATLEELLTITGIGESKAKKIIEYRSTTPFNKIEDIKNVSGIGDSIFEKIKDYISV